jgi:hypothetical protein
MPAELIDDKKKSIKEIYNDSVKLLELLNVLIPKIETYDPKLPAEFIQEVADKCFELGSLIATSADYLEDKAEANQMWPDFASGGC